MNTIWSTTKGRNLRKFDRNLEKHGKGAATDDTDFAAADVKTPYAEASLGGYVLACTDCHEPHGSPNVFLVRKWVNNITPDHSSSPWLENIPVTVTVTTETGGEGTNAWQSLCTRCHLTNKTYAAHHTKALTDRYTCMGTPPVPSCHLNPPESIYQVCIACHNHGSTEISLQTGKESYNGGEHLF